MAVPGTITIKVVLDTTEAEAKLAALQANAANLRPVVPKQGLPYSIGEIARLFDGCWISPQEAEYLINCIKSRTY